jgi:signal transduction histidine kinase
MPLCKKECELASISRTVIDSLSTTAGGRKVSLKVEERISATCDPDLVRRVLQNILANALKFTPATAAIDIDVSLEEGAA